MLINFEEAKQRLETREFAAVENELRQQVWFQNAEAKYKKKRDFVIIIFTIDAIMGMIAILLI